jgi:symplekin
MVPPNHTLIPPRNLEAEASGLLDRMLGVFQESVRFVGFFSFLLLLY